MRKRLSDKVLAVILTLAICATTVFGCLMTVSAAVPCYSFASSAQFVGDDLTQATLDVTFTAPSDLASGFYAGKFSLEEVNATAEDCLVVKNVEAVTEGIMLTEAEDVKNYFLFESDEACSELVIRFTFGFSAGQASLTGKEYKVTLKNVELAYNDDAYYVESGSAYGVVSAGCKHVITPVGSPMNVDAINGYSVYENSVCTLCGENFGYQLVPSAENLNEEGGASNIPTDVDVF